MQSDNFFVITGGPGAGKTTLVQAIADEGWVGVAESGREIIRERKARGESPRPSPQEFLELMLERDVRKYTSAVARRGTFLFDRGIVDHLGYTGTDLDLTAARAAAQRHRYNETVFIAPPWPEIYVNDEDRDQTFEDALQICDAIATGYAAAGYRLVDLPKADVAERVAFILEAAHTSR